MEFSYSHELSFEIYYYIDLLIAYLIGTIPSGYIVTQLAGQGDIRKVGSGNIGATNVLRTGRKDLALLTLFLDFSKGAAVILGAKYIFFVSSAWPPTTFGLCAVIGHCFPVWLKFRGGKGVATAFGALIFAVPWAGFLAAVSWGIVAGFTRLSSLAALSAAALTPLFTIIYYGPYSALTTAAIAILIFWRHKENIQRLAAGTEPKIGARKKEEQKEQDEPAADTE